MTHGAAPDRVTELLMLGKQDFEAGRGQECLRLLDEARTLALTAESTRGLIRLIDATSAVVRNRCRTKLI